MASLLDEGHSSNILELTAQVAEEAGPGGVSPWPHVTYHVAGDYDLARLEAVLGDLAAASRALVVRTSGLGVFTGPHPVLYIPVVRGPELTSFHKQVWSAIASLSRDQDVHYHPGNWIPHITLLEADSPEVDVWSIARRLADRDFYWEIAVDNLAVLRGGGSSQELIGNFRLAGGVARNF